MGAKNHDQHRPPRVAPPRTNGDELVRSQIRGPDAQGLLHWLNWFKKLNRVRTLEENAACQMGIDGCQRPIQSHHPNVQLPERLAPANPQDSN